MHRRDILHSAAWTAIAACAPVRRAPRYERVRAIAFDLFTLFDPRSVDRRAAEVIPDEPERFAAAWMSRLFEYCWLCALAERYAPFDRLVLEALDYAGRLRNVTLSDGERDHLAAVFTQLEPWPDARASLEALRARDLRLAPLANFAPGMIHELLAGADLEQLFERQISTDAARTYKPDPRAYALAEHTFDLARSEIAFAAFGRWDAWGASAFGLRAFWVNRNASPDELGGAVSSGSDLAGLAAWLQNGAAS